MTNEQAIAQLEGAEAMLLNRDHNAFNAAVITAINALRKQQAAPSVPCVPGDVVFCTYGRRYRPCVVSEVILCADGVWRVSVANPWLGTRPTYALGTDAFLTEKAAKDSLKGECPDEEI